MDAGRSMKGGTPRVGNARLRTEQIAFSGPFPGIEPAACQCPAGVCDQGMRRRAVFAAQEGETTEEATRDNSRMVPSMGCLKDF